MRMEGRQLDARPGGQKLAAREAGLGWAAWPLMHARAGLLSDCARRVQSQSLKQTRLP